MADMKELCRRDEYDKNGRVHEMGKMKEQSEDNYLNGAVPDWAIREASTSLAHGGQVFEIESNLIAKGLNPQQASAATEQWFVRRFRLVTQERERNARWRMRIGILLILCSLIILSATFVYAWNWQWWWRRSIGRLAGLAAGMCLTAGVRLIYLAWGQRPANSDEELARNVLG